MYLCKNKVYVFGCFVFLGWKCCGNNPTYEANTEIVDAEYLCLYAAEICIMSSLYVFVRACFSLTHRSISQRASLLEQFVSVCELQISQPGRQSKLNILLMTSKSSTITAYLPEILFSVAHSIRKIEPT